MKRGSVQREQRGLPALLLIIFATTVSGVHAQETISSPLPEAQIHEVAARILKKASKADCKRGDCRIVVANFAFSSGLTSPLGVELADQFSREFASQRNPIRVIDRSEFRSYLERQRIPGALLNDEKTMRWLGLAAGTTSILTGALEENGSSLELRLHLLSCGNDKAAPEESITFSYSGSPSDLNRAEAYPQQLPSTGIFGDPSTREAGKSGVTSPRCVYCPNPDYTNAARRVKFSGRAVLEVVVSEHGQPLQARVVRGLPYGLNDASVDAVRSWKFTPAVANGQPVTVKVPIEVTFNILR